MWPQRISTWYFALFPPADVRVQRAIRRILERQARDANEKLNESWYWGPIGGDVFDAVRAADTAIGSVATSGHIYQYLIAVEDALAEAHERYRRDAVDEGGYGSATFHEIRRGIKALRR